MWLCVAWGFFELELAFRHKSDIVICFSTRVALIFRHN